VKHVRAGYPDDVGERDLDAVVVGEVVVGDEPEGGRVPAIHLPVPPPTGQLRQLSHSTIIACAESRRHPPLPRTVIAGSRLSARRAAISRLRSAAARGRSGEPTAGGVPCRDRNVSASAEIWTGKGARIAALPSTTRRCRVTYDESGRARWTTAAAASPDGPAGPSGSKVGRCRPVRSSPWSSRRPGGAA